MTRTQILTLLIKELAEMDVDVPNPPSETLSFRHDLGMDSLDIAEYAARMEQCFRVIIADEEVAKLHTLGHAADYVEERLTP